MLELICCVEKPEIERLLSHVPWMFGDLETTVKPIRNSSVSRHDITEVFLFLAVSQSRELVDQCRGGGRVHCTTA